MKFTYDCCLFFNLYIWHLYIVDVNLNFYVVVLYEKHDFYEVIKNLFTLRVLVNKVNVNLVFDFYWFFFTLNEIVLNDFFWDVSFNLDYFFVPFVNRVLTLLMWNFSNICLTFLLNFILDYNHLEFNECLFDIELEH